MTPKLSDVGQHIVAEIVTSLSIVGNPDLGAPRAQFAHFRLRLHDIKVIVQLHKRYYSGDIRKPSEIRFDEPLCGYWVDGLDNLPVLNGREDIEHDALCGTVIYVPWYVDATQPPEDEEALEDAKRAYPSDRVRMVNPVMRITNRAVSWVADDPNDVIVETGEIKIGLLAA